MPGDHDALVKKVFSVPENAAGELRAVLPAELADRLAWQTLSLAPGSFVDDKRAEHHTDLLFSVEAKGGQDLRLYILFEHQSTPSKGMPLRMLTYLGRVYAALADKAEPPLPVVLPFVLHHSKSGWTAATQFRDMLDIPEDLEPLVRGFIPDFRFLVDDLGDATDRQLLARQMPAAAKLTVWILAAIRRPHDASLILQWLSIADTVTREARGEVADTIFGYLSEVGLAEPVLNALLDARTNSDTKRTIMGLRKQWEDAALQKGRKEGRASTLLKLLELRFSEVSANDVARVQSADIADIDRWTERVLTADTLADVFHGHD